MDVHAGRHLRLGPGVPESGHGEDTASRALGTDTAAPGELGARPGTAVGHELLGPRAATGRAVHTRRLGARVPQGRQAACARQRGGSVVWAGVRVKEPQGRTRQPQDPREARPGHHLGCGEEALPASGGTEAWALEGGDTPRACQDPPSQSPTRRHEGMPGVSPNMEGAKVLGPAHAEPLGPRFSAHQVGRPAELPRGTRPPGSQGHSCQL